MRAASYFIATCCHLRRSCVFAHMMHTSPTVPLVPCSPKCLASASLPPSQSSTLTGKDWGWAVALWAFLQAIRAAGIALLYPLCSRLGYGRCGQRIIPVVCRAWVHERRVLSWLVCIWHYGHTPQEQRCTVHAPLQAATWPLSAPAFCHLQA